MKAQQKRPCPSCNGTKVGPQWFSKHYEEPAPIGPCPTCKGTGIWVGPFSFEEGCDDVVGGGN